MNAVRRLRRTFWWIRLPFTYGHALGHDDGGEHVEDKDGERSETAVLAEFVKFDGLISAIQGFLLIIATTWTMTFAVHVSPHFNGSVSLVTLILFMLAGLVVMCALNQNREKVLVLVAATGTHDQSRDRLTLIGMTIFYAIVCLMDLFHILASVVCDEAWKMCKDGRIYGSYVTAVTFHVVRIVYLGAETLLCVMHHRSTFSARPSTRYGLMLLQAVNFSIWFDAFIHESVHLFDASHAKLEDLNQRCLADVSNVSTDTLGCLYHNNTIYRLVDNFVNPTFLPFTIEFTILVGECVFHWYYHCSALASSQQSVGDTVDQATYHQSSSVEENNVSDGRSSFEEDLPNGVVLESLGSFSESVPGNPLPLAESVTGVTSRSNSLLSFAVFFVIIALNVTLCFLVIRQKFARDEDTIGCMKVYLHYLGIFWICMTVSIAAGYHSSAKFRVSREPFTVLEYLLVFTSLGPYTVNVLTLISIGELGPNSNMNVSTSSQSAPFSPAFPMILELLNASEVYFQVGFCLYAARILIDLQDTSHRTIVFKGAVLFLGVANGALWFSSNTAGGGDITVEFMYLRTVFGEVGWKYIRNVFVLFPVSVFHRFISCLLFVKTYLRLS